MFFRRCLSVLILICLMTSIVSCDRGETEMPDEFTELDARGVPIVGEYIRCSETEPANAVTLINDQGMSGLRAPNHLHNTKEEFSYLTQENGSEGAIVFTFPQVESLGYLYIWNYNGNGETGNGMKDIKLEYSADHQTWNTLGDGEYQLAEALKSENERHGGNAANNLNDGKRSPIPFQGIPVKYVRITPLSNHGGTGYGLSEVRFFRYKTRPLEGSVLSVTASAPLQSVKDANALTSHLGMSDLDSEQAVQNADPNAMWYSASENPEDAMLLLNLDGNYPLEKLLIWNYNAPEHTNRGMKEITIEYTVKNPAQIQDGTILYTGGEWTSLGTYTIPEAAGEDALAPSIAIDLKNIHAQYIRIVPKSNYGGSGFGLSSLRFFTGTGWAVEPSREWTGLFSSEGSFPYQQSGQNPRNGYGWLAADGIYSVHMNGKDQMGAATEDSKTVFLFSDTGIGNFRQYAGTYGKHGDTMLFGDMRNHSMVTLTGKEPDPRNMQVYLHSGSGYGNIFDRTAWAQELVKVGDQLYSWAMRFQGWDPYQYDLVKMDLREDGFPDFSRKPTVTDAFPIKEKEGIYTYDFSAALLDNTETGGASTAPDGYIYIYGLLGWNDGFWLQKAPVVARVRPEEFADRSCWRFWTGAEWDPDLKKAANINAKGADVSSEYSVSYMTEGPFQGKYMMTYTKDTMFNEVCFRVADTPYGPFGDATTLYYSPDVYTILQDAGCKDGYTYNAKAHPHLSAKGELLMSYNVNSGTYKTDLEFLHPQFLNLFGIQPVKE